MKRYKELYSFRFCCFNSVHFHKKCNIFSNFKIFKQMKLNVIMCFLVLLSILCCNKNSTNKDDADKMKKSKIVIDTINKNKIDKDSSIAVQESILIRDAKACSFVDKKNEEESFLNDFISYFSVNVINEHELVKERFYKSLLQNTFIDILPKHFFEKKYNTFSLQKKYIKNYGECYIAEYYFNTAEANMQTKFYIIVNMDKKEISIWNFDNLKVKENGIECDFNVRGKSIIYNFFYLNRCKKFVLR